jgi:hypothetical protein
MQNSKSQIDSGPDDDLIRRVALYVEQRRLTRRADVSISAHGGVVSLRGTVPTFHERQVIVASALRVAGVIQIRDELDVVSPQPTVRLPASQRITLTAIATTVALFAAAVIAGCNRSGGSRVATIPAKGSITYQGQPMSGAFLALHPKSGTRRDVPTSTAVVRPDGSFQLSTYDSADGAPEGEYVVTVQWHKLVKSGSDYQPGPNLLPQKYSDPAASDATVKIASGQNELPPIVLRR